MIKKFLILFVFIIQIQIIVFSQNNFAIPFFKNYKSIDYNQESQNYSTTINPNTGIVYIVNSNGILEFDNSNWNFIETTNTPSIAFNNKNELFYCCSNEFGKIDLVKHNTIKLIDFENGDLSDIFIIEDKIFLVSNKILYKVFAENDKYNYIKIYEGVDYITKIDDNLFCHNYDLGFSVFNENGEIIKHKLNGEISNQEVLSIIKYKRDFLIRLADNSFWNFSTRNDVFSRKYTTQADDILENLTFSCMAATPTSDLLIGTKQNGVICIDRRRRTKYILNQNFGLCNNLVHDIFIDSNNNLAWISTNNGISVVDIHNNFSVYNENHGLIGNILAIYKDKNDFYIGTSVGVYYFSDENINEEKEKFNTNFFLNIKNIKAKCWKLIKIKNNIYAVTDRGFYLINKNESELLIEANFKTIAKIGNDKYLITGKTASYILDFSNEIMEKTKIINFPDDVRTIAFDNNSIWMGSDFRKLYYIKDKNDINDSTVVVDTTSMLPASVKWVDVYNSKKALLFSTNSNVFYLDKTTNTLLPDTTFPFENAKQFYYPIYVDSNDNIWYVNNNYNNISRRELSLKQDGNYLSEKLNNFKFLKYYNVESLFVENDNDALWIGTTEGIIKCSNVFRKNYHKKNNCFIKEIKLKNNFSDTSIYCGYEDSIFNITLQVDKNSSISFSFASNFYTSSPDKIEYQYILESFDKKDNLSEWTILTTKEYTSLNGGSYKFVLRAKDIYGNISSPCICNLNLIEKKSVFVHPLMIFFYFIFFISLVLLIITIIIRQNKHEKLVLAKKVLEQTREISLQKEKIEKIMKQWLPAKEIKSEEDYKNKTFESVTVIFADIAGFSKLINKDNQEQILEMLNFIFQNFDDIIKKYKITKIKTIGDAYMCVSGIEKQDNTHCILATLAAMEMQRFLKQYNEKNQIKMEMRFGIHSGTIIAGVVGKNKLEYDVWGDTVNIANRMQSNGIVNKLNFSPEAYELARYFFDFEYRGKVAVKFIGDVSMYIVKNIKSTLTNDGITPNRNFELKLQFLKFKVLENKIIAKLHAGLSSNLYYHNVSHTIDVVYSVENIGRKENITEEEMLLLKCAALFHDTGFLICYDGHEEESEKMAEYYLENYAFTKEQIETVKQLIRVTKAGVKPTNLLEMIICDADLNYLIRPDFIPISENLFREVYERHKVSSKEAWYKKQYDFILQHSYYTKTIQAKNIRKESLLNELKKYI